MIVGIDGNEANVENKVGVNRFAFEVIWQLYRLRRKGELDEDQFLIFLSNKPNKDLPKETNWWKYEVFGPKRLWTRIALVKRLFLGSPRPNVFFSPSHYGPLLSPIPYMISIMDLGFLQWPSQFKKKDFAQLKNWTDYSARKAKRIIAISEFTKKDIVKNYSVDSEKIIVAYPGFTKTKEKKNKVVNKIKGEYIFYLGTLKPSKNIEGLIDAFYSLREDYQIKGVKLVIAGKKGWLYEKIFEKVKESSLERQVIFTDYVSDERAEALMKSAKVFVLPSFWEGFGIPVLEAMSFSVPVVSSNRGSLPEVVDSAAILVNPGDTEEMTLAIKEVLTDNERRKALIKAGKRRVRLFSWENCSKIIYQELKNYENW